MSKKKKLSFSRAYEVFVGSYVTLVVKSVKGGTRNRINNLMFAGYMLDECESFFYIGEKPDEISAAIQKSDVATIIAGDTTQMNDIEVPEGVEVQ